MNLFFKVFPLKKWVAFSLIVCFSGLVHTATTPGPVDTQPPSGKRSLSAGIDRPGVFEAEAESAAIKKKKRILPLIIAGVGVLGVAAAVYFLFLKKKEQLQDDFTSNAAKEWIPRHPAEWSVAEGMYTCASTIPETWDFNVYNKAWSKSQYTVAVRLMRVQDSGTKGVLLATGISMDSVSGYFFDLSSQDQSYSVWKYSGKNLIMTGGNTEALIHWTTNPAILNGAGAWNEIKILRDNATYSFVVNNTLLQSFTDTTFDPRYIVLQFEVAGSETEMWFDYVHVDVGKPSSLTPPSANLFFIRKGETDTEIGTARLQAH